MYTNSPLTCKAFCSSTDLPVQQVVRSPQSTVLQAACGCSLQVQDQVWSKWDPCKWSPALLDWKCQWTHSSKPAWLQQRVSPPGSTAWWSQHRTRLQTVTTLVQVNRKIQLWGLYCWCNEDKAAIQISVTMFFQIQLQDFCFCHYNWKSSLHGL